MSKTKIGNINFTDHVIKDCVLREYSPRNKVTVFRERDDPGAVYVTITTHTDWCCVLRGVYNTKKAKNVPKPGKPEVSGFSIKVGCDTMHVVVGNYNIDGNVKSPAESDHEMIDDIVLIMSTMDEPRNIHDADGFIRLERTGSRRGGYYSLRDDDRDRDPEDDGSGISSDTEIEVDNVYKSNDDVINLVNAITMFANRANVMYGGYGGYYGYDGDIDVSLGRVVLPQKAMAAVTDAMEKCGFLSHQVDMFVNTIMYGLTLTETDRKLTRSRFNRIQARRFRPDPFV